jgi:HK97 family phage major capsid protein
MADIKEFLTTSSGTEGSLLIEKKIYDTLIEAVQKKLVGRALAAIYIGPDGIPGSSVDIDTVDADSMAVTKVAEGAAVPIETVGYSSANHKPAKYGVRPLITKEMQEDAKWDLIAHNIMVAGREMAENEDALIITALDNAANTVSGGASVTIANITRAMQYLEDSDYAPTDMLVGPEVANDLRNIDTFVEADKLGSREMLDTGYIGKLFGMNVHVISAAIITSTNAYVIDKNHAFVIAEKRPVTIEQYDDATHDLSGVVVTQRIAVGYLRTSAIAKITSS